MAKETIYLDVAATCPPRPEMIKLFKENDIFFLGNPSSAHTLGRKANKYLDKSRELIAKFLNCEPEEVYFTSGATEACNWAIKTLAGVCENIVHPEINTEHEAVRASVASSTASGVLRKNGYYKMLVNNETGDIYDMPKRENEDDLIFTDATSAVGNMIVDFKELGVDYLAFGGHKFGGLVGAGCLIAKKDAPLAPLIAGGGQEREMRGGTENLPAIYSMALALESRPNCALEHREWVKAIEERRKIILDGLQKGELNLWFLKHYGEAGVVLNRQVYRTPASLVASLTQALPTHQMLSNIINLRFDGVYGSTLAMMLAGRGIMVSTGAACHSQDLEPSKVLKAIGLTDKQALSSIRISFDERITLEQCDKVAKEIAECVEWIREKGVVRNDE